MNEATKVEVLQDFTIPNEPAFKKGMVVYISDSIVGFLKERGLVQAIKEEKQFHSKSEEKRIKTLKGE